MTQDEYVTRIGAVESSLPMEFGTYVAYDAWRRGHSAGYAEVVLIAEEMAYDLRGVIAAYNKRMGIN